jgi:hypothetical protein
MEYLQCGAAQVTGEPVSVNFGSKTQRRERTDGPRIEAAPVNITRAGSA